MRNKRFKQGLPIRQLILWGWLPSSLKRFIYKWQGAKIGKRVSFGFMSYLKADQIEIGNDVRIGPFSFVKAVEKIRIGNRARIGMFVAVETGSVSIGHDSVIMEQVSIGGMLTSRSSIEIHNRVKIFPFSFLNPTMPILIEDDVGIGGGNYIFTHGTWQSMLEGYPGGFGPVTIKKGTWLPWRVFVMPNVTIGEYATIGAGAVVTKDVPDGTLAVGSPAKGIKSHIEYVRQTSTEDRHKFMGKVFAEFDDYLRYVGFEVDIKGDESQNFVLVVKGDEPVRVIYKKEFESSDAFEKSDVIVSLTKLNQVVLDKIIALGCHWYDLTSKACSEPSAGPSMEVRNFMSRYGMKFEVIGESRV